MSKRMSEEDYDNYTELMDARDPRDVNAQPSWYMPTYDNPPMDDPDLEMLLRQEEIIAGNRMMNERTPHVGHKPDMANHPNRRVDRQSFGL